MSTPTHSLLAYVLILPAMLADDWMVVP